MISIPIARTRTYIKLYTILYSACNDFRDSNKQKSEYLVESDYDCDFILRLVFIFQSSYWYDIFSHKMGGKNVFVCSHSHPINVA